jgi:EAL domain-containing protein (putative c-di-GMP-specific phosphodiesterase class I)
MAQSHISGRTTFQGAGQRATLSSVSEGHLAKRIHVEVLKKTLGLAQSSAAAQALAIVLLSIVFRGTAVAGACLGLACGVVLICGAMIAATRHWLGLLREQPTDGAVRWGERITVLAAGSLGAAWATLPVMVLPVVGAADCIIVLATCLGLVSHAMTLGPVFAVSALLAGPVAGGTLVGLALSEAPLSIPVMVLFVGYSLFALLKTRRFCRLSRQRIADRVFVERQSETLRLLLKDVEKGVRNCPAITDGAGTMGVQGCPLKFDPTEEARAIRERRLDRDMRSALTAGELELHYQPLVAMRSGRVVGVEALLRWHKPGEGWISPGELIPIAEASGFIVELGRWALRRACTDVLNWPGMQVAVNISSTQVRLPTFAAEVAATLQETGLAPQRLEIEITESVLLDHGTEVLDNLKSLRDLGVRIALDDFGTGYSSLSYLTEFPFDKVKVDRSFIRDLQSRPEKIAVIEAIARMAQALHMDVTVEGVETRQQLDVLREKRCDIAQGFFYSAARPASEIPEVVARIEDAAAAMAALPWPEARPARLSPVDLSCAS